MRLTALSHHLYLPRLAVAVAFALIALISMAPSAIAAELVMYESPGCPWCARWRAEVGPAYARSDEGHRAPLRNVELSADAGVQLLSPVVVSPTFVLVDNGREIGRIVGYPGPDFFWGLLDVLMKKLPSNRSGAADLMPDRSARSAALGLEHARFACRIESNHLAGRCCERRG